MTRTDTKTTASPEECISKLKLFYVKVFFLVTSLFLYLDRTKTEEQRQSHWLIWVSCHPPAFWTDVCSVFKTAVYSLNWDHSSGPSRTNPMDKHEGHPAFTVWLLFCWCVSTLRFHVRYWWKSRGVNKIYFDCSIHEWLNLHIFLTHRRWVFS